MALIKIAGIEGESIVDGPGYRYVIFTQGCPHLCHGCHNPQTHDFHGGKEISTEEILASIKENPLLDGVTFSGGEPFCQAKVLASMLPEIKAMGLNLLAFTGYTWEELRSNNDSYVQELLTGLDILIDGPFKQELRDISLNFRGSSNQRIIDVQKSLKENSIITMEL